MVFIYTSFTVLIAARYLKAKTQMDIIVASVVNQGT